MNPIRILIADDHPLFRDGMAALLRSLENVELVGQAKTGEEVIELADALQPDVILMDIRMPDVNGIEATRRILEASPHISVLIVTMVEDSDSLSAALRAGARGYLLKGADQAEVMRAIQAVSNNEAIFSSAVVPLLSNIFSASRGSAALPVFPDLTRREHEILTFIAQGQSNTQIADRLVLSPRTVRNHISNIFSKLGDVDRAQAIILAREAGLGRLES
ncbi:MAG: response regulator transcription factor [Chloroflexota bacterium]